MEGGKFQKGWWQHEWTFRREGMLGEKKKVRPGSSLAAETPET